jgi:nicotinate-nucleotide pyrophosphorylase (carboxylating)
MDWNSSDIRGLVVAALAEDVGTGDITVAATIREEARARARIVANQLMICAGLPLAEKLFQVLDPKMGIELRAADGQQVRNGQDILHLRGAVSAMLTGERTALNFLGHLCGIATQTRLLVEQIAGSQTEIRGTRHTTPGLRLLEQYAVEVGGGKHGHNGLFDAILITTNHIAIAGGVKAALDQAHTYASSQMTPRSMTAYEAVGMSPSGVDGTSLSIQIEVRNEAELREALSAGAQSLLLVNTPPDHARDLIQIVRRASPDCIIEISSDFTPANVRAYAQSGANYLSCRALTLSAPKATLSLLVDNPQ